MQTLQPRCAELRQAFRLAAEPAREPAPKRRSLTGSARIAHLRAKIQTAEAEARATEMARRTRARKAARILADRHAMAIGRACMRRMAVDPAFRQQITSLVYGDRKACERADAVPLRSADL